MSDAPATVPAETIPPPAAVPAAVLKPARSLFPGWVWLLPGVVLILVSAVVFWSWWQRGERVVVHFKEGHGLKTGDPVRSRGITVGEVSAVELSPDLQSVDVVIDLRPSADNIAVQGSRFWVVRPQADLTGVSGLDTVVGAKYIAVFPGSGSRLRKFDGLDEPPVLESLDPRGLEIVIEGNQMGGLRPGVPLMHRQVRIGSVLTKPTRNGNTIEVRGYIFPGYADLVRENSVFWNVSGFRLNGGLTSGLTLKAESLETVLAGGIAMTTPGTPGSVVPNGHRFQLASEPPKERGDRIQVTFKDGHGLKPGDVLRHRGITLGEVNSVALAPTMQAVEVVIDLLPGVEGIAVQGSRFWIVRMQADLPALSVSGLDTMVGGKYLAVSPGQGPVQHKFVGLEEPPVQEIIEPGGLDIVLQGKRMGGLRLGVPLTYRQVRIGTVLSAQLANDASAVEVHVYVRPAYAGLVRENSVFWNTSGLKFGVDWRGLSVDADSMMSVLAGGLAMATPDNPGKAVQNGKRFELADEAPKDASKWSPSLPLVDLHLPADKSVPRLVRATLRYQTPGKVFGKTLHEQRGLLLPVDRSWLLGPEDLLVVPSAAIGGHGTLACEGESQSITAEKSTGDKIAPRLSRINVADQSLAKKLEGSVSLSRLQAPKEIEDCLLVADSSLAPVLVSKARLKADAGSWKLESASLSGAADPTDERWHGAAAVSVATGDVIGVLWVPEKNKGPRRILPLTAALLEQLRR
jgi:paraquat-inducible protein B